MIENKKARFDYDTAGTIECGIQLEGWEVKFVASGACSIAGTYCKIINNELFLIGATIGKMPNDITRTRKLLLRREEINKLTILVREKGITLVPLKIYLSCGKFKITISVAKGKNEYDKRETQKKHDVDNELRRTIKSQKLAFCD